MSKERTMKIDELKNIFIAANTKGYDLRLKNNNDKWLVFSGSYWIVYYKKLYARKTIELYKGNCLAAAVNVLME